MNSGKTLAGTVHHPFDETRRGVAILCHGMDSNRNSEKLVHPAPGVGGSEDLEITDVLQASRKVVCPVLIIHGDADEVVPSKKRTS